MIITIDGPSASGKGTVAKDLAEHLGFVHFDTGAMYRAFTYFLMKEGLDYQKPEQVKNALSRFSYDIQVQDGVKHYLVNKEDVSEAIRTLEVTQLVSQVSTIPEVREFLVAIQKEYGRSHNSVFEGRDLGTVVFPEAELKIFLTASPRVRAQRRYDELEAKGLTKGISVDQMEAELQERDRRDSERELSPLRQAEDAHLVDSSELSVPEVVESIMDLYASLSI